MATRSVQGARDTLPTGEPAMPAARRDVTEYGTRRIIIAFAVILAAMLEIIDTTIVNVALPYIQGNVGASQDEGAFIVTSYIVANVIVIPLSPWLQRRFGRRQYFAGSIIVFTAASLMCGFSRSLWPLVFWRFVQGAGGGGLLSQAQAILRETFPKKQQGAAQGLFAVGALFGPSIGPLMGGLLVDNFSWPWIFFVNLPIGIVAATFTIFYMRNPEDPQALPLDTVGISLLAVGLGALQYVLDQGQEKDWFGDGLITWLSGIAVVSLAAFLVWEMVGTRRPAVDLRVLRYRSVWAGSVLGFVLGITLLGTLITLPQFVQGSLNFTATLSGQLLITRALPVMLLTPLAVFLATRMRVDPRLQIGLGFVCIGLSNFLLADVTTSQSDFWKFGISLALSGVGLSQVFIPLSLVIFGSVSPPDIPKASSFFNLSRQLGGSVATAVLITLLDRSEVAHQSQLAGETSLTRSVVRAYVASEGIVSPVARDNLAGIVSGQAVVLAYADVSRFVGIITLGLAPLSLLLSVPKGKPEATAEA
jgi:DHA2 family multidrug resistance protein